VELKDVREICTPARRAYDQCLAASYGKALCEARVKMKEFKERDEMRKEKGGGKGRCQGDSAFKQQTAWPIGLLCHNFGPHTWYN
jgi:hypothetical protein